jgi:hypothetical protein
MFAHTGSRALWPVIFFLPWLFLGSAYLGEWVLQQRPRRIRPSRVGPRHRMALSAGRLRLIALGFFLIIAPLALADQAAEGRVPCPVTTPQEARRLGDTLYEQGAYQSAAECYQAAGEYVLADRAYVKAVGPESAATAHQLSEQRDQAKTMLRKLQLAFRSEHRE